jgi:hypothetical protein
MTAQVVDLFRNQPIPPFRRPGRGRVSRFHSETWGYRGNVVALEEGPRG